MTSETCSVGLNLTSANFVLLLEPFLTGAEEGQAAARVHRIGQTRPVNVVKFFTKGSIDERILSLRQRRGELEDDTNGGGAGGLAEETEEAGEESAATSRYSEADRRLLFGS